MPADGINMSEILEIFQVYKDDQGSTVNKSCTGPVGKK
jgi:hypothetical protein